MTQTAPTRNGTYRTVDREHNSPITRVLGRLSSIHLPSKDLFEAYMRHKWRLNHSRQSMNSSFLAIDRPT